MIQWVIQWLSAAACAPGGNYIGGSGCEGERGKAATGDGQAGCGAVRWWSERSWRRLRGPRGEALIDSHPPTPILSAVNLQRSLTERQKESKGWIERVGEQERERERERDRQKLKRKLEKERERRFIFTTYPELRLESALQQITCPNLNRLLQGLHSYIQRG